MENATSTMTSERSQTPLPIFPPELWIEVVNNLRLNDQHPVIFPGYNRPDKALLSRLSLCSKSFKQLLEPMMWEIVLLAPDKNGWTKSLANAAEIIQSEDRQSWVKYFAFRGSKAHRVHLLAPGDRNTIETLFQHLPNLCRVYISGLQITLPIAAALFRLPKLRYVELDGTSCDVDCGNSPSESFRLTELLVVGNPYESRESTIIRALASSNHLTGLMIKTDNGWSNTRGVLLDHRGNPFTRLRTLALPQPSKAADLRFLLSLTAHFPAVTSLELYTPQLMLPGEKIASKTVPIPDNIFPNLQNFRGALYLAKGLTNKRPVHSLCILCGNSSLTHEDLTDLSTGSVSLKTLRIYTAHYMDNCLRDIARALPDLEDLSIIIGSGDQPRADPWPVLELEPLKKLRKLRLGRPWSYAGNLFNDDRDMTRVRGLISTLQTNHSAISTIDLNRNLEWGRVGAVWKIVNLNRKPHLGAEETARLSALGVPIA